MQEFEKIKKAKLNLQKDTSDVFSRAIDKRYRETCQWIFEDDQYVRWNTSSGDKMLCITGQQGEIADRG